jgi:hypothetical protein
MPLLSNKDLKPLTVLFQVNATDIPMATVGAKVIVLKAALP